MTKLSRVRIEGYKSISKKIDIELGDINIMIGANGAGKSNFVSFFTLLNQMVNGNLQFYTQKQGGPDSILSYGRKITPKMCAKVYFGLNGYFFNLEATSDNRFIFESEYLYFDGPYYGAVSRFIGRGHDESKAPAQLKDPGNRKIAEYVVPALQKWRVYHFHDTSESASVKQIHDINDNETLRGDAANLAAFLFRMKQEASDNYEAIKDAITLVAPYFGDFHLRPMPSNKDKIQLEWTEKHSDYPFRAQHLSDGTLRFICLATLLLQPRRPYTIVIDEPELGLHPYAITILASMFRSVSKRGTQILASTQSVPLLNEFDPDDVIVVDRVENTSCLKRLNEKDLSEWLESYSLGEMWEKNIFGGKPSL